MCSSEQKWLKVISNYDFYIHQKSEIQYPLVLEIILPSEVEIRYFPFGLKSKLIILPLCPFNVLASHGWEKAIWETFLVSLGAFFCLLFCFSILFPFEFFVLASEKIIKHACFFIIIKYKSSTKKHTIFKLKNVKWKMQPTVEPRYNANFGDRSKLAL